MSVDPITIFVPCDAAALSVGADAVASAIAAQADQRDISVRIVRNGSRGMLWLEPLVEIATAIPRNRSRVQMKHHVDALVCLFHRTR